MEFRVLGPLEVIGPDGLPVEVRGGRERLVLAALSMDAGSHLPTDRLLDLVWGAAQPENPANALQAVISRLRRMLGADRIRTSKRGYALVLDRGELDAWVFEDLVNRAGDRAPADPATAESMCADALALWRGEPLANEFDDASLRPSVTRWRELRRRAIVLRASCLLELGRASEAVAIAAPSFDEDPLDEGLARAAMSALHRVGRQAEALRVGQRHRAALADAGLEAGAGIVVIEQQILDPAARTQMLGRVPPPYFGDRFFGREAELAAGEASVAEHRLTTLTGPGGVGKTRLARELALRNPGWWCDLSLVPLGADVPAAMCTQLRIRPEQGASAEHTLSESLQTEAGLLVLDNCDGLTEAVANVMRSLLARCPDVNVLTTCRTALGVAGEQTIEVAPLQLGVASAAADLFVDRARAVTPLTDADRETVGAIVARLDGLPLAIELAAGRLGVLGIDELVDQLTHHVGGLSTPEAARPARHRSLNAVVEGSWLQLAEREQQLAGALGVFQGSFTVADASAVTGAGPASCADVVDVLRRSSLLQPAGRRRSPRFRYLVPVREFVWARTVDAGSSNRVEQAHTAWVLDNLNLARTLRRGPAEAESVRFVDELWPEVVAATARAAPAQRVALLAALAELQAMRLTAEDAAAFTAAADRTDVEDAWLMAGAAQAAFLAGDLARVEKLCATSIAFATSSGLAVPWLVLWLRGSIPMFAGNPSESRVQLEALAATTTDRWEQVFLQGAAAFAAALAGSSDAVDLAASNLDSARELENATCQAWALCALATASSEKDLAGALEAYEESLALATGVANQVTAGVVRPHIAALRDRVSRGTLPRVLDEQLGEWQRRGNRSHAVELVAQAIPVLGTAQEHRTIALLAGATRTASGFGLQPPRVRQRIEEAIREARAALGDDRFAAVQAEGTLIGVDEAVTITRSALQRIDER